MIQRLCAIVMITVVANSGEIRRERDTGVTCQMCQDSECLKNKPARIMDCSKNKMSSMNLAGKAKQTWDLLVAGSSELDDPAKYTVCAGLSWNYEAKRLGFLAGCAPETVGEKPFCNYAVEKAKENNYNFTNYKCFSCRPGEKNCSDQYPVFQKTKNCYVCQDKDCSKEMIFDCTDIKPRWKGRSKVMWDLITAEAPELADSNEYTSCVHLDWKNKAGKETKIWSCAPDLLGKEEFCDYVNKTSMKNDYILAKCEICTARDTPCLGKPIWRKEANCHVSQDPNELYPERIMNCNKERMGWMHLTGNVKKMWDLLTVGHRELENPLQYDSCFTMSWDRDGETGYLAGCAPEMVGMLEFCSYVNETAAKDNYKVFNCQIAPAVKEPLFYQPWDKPKKCYTCQGSECSEPSKILDCNNTRMNSVDWDFTVKYFWDSLLTTDEEWNLDNYNQCFGIVWEIVKFSEKVETLWSCTPAFVSNEKFCDFAKETAIKKKYSLVACHTCRANEEPCFKTLSWTTTERTTTALAEGPWKTSSARSLYDRALLPQIFWGVLLVTIFGCQNFSSIWG